MIINPKKARSEIAGYLVNNTDIYKRIQRGIARAKLERIFATLSSKSAPSEDEIDA